MCLKTGEMLKNVKTFQPKKTKKCGPKTLLKAFWLMHVAACNDKYDGNSAVDQHALTTLSGNLLQSLAGATLMRLGTCTGVM